MGEPGRPTLYTQAVADEIIEKLSAGIPLATICQADHLPALRTVKQWNIDNAEFSARHQIARDDGEDMIAADCLNIADDGRNDFMEGVNQGGTTPGVIYSAEHVNRSKLRIETRLKLLAVWNRPKYGQHTTLAGSKTDPLIPPASSETDLRSEIATLQAKIEAGQ